MKPPFIEKRQEQRVYRIVPVVSEGQFIALKLDACIGKNSTAHFCAQCAGVFLLTVVEYYISDLCFSDVIRDFKGFTQSGDFRIIRTTQSVIHSNCLQFKILIGKLPVQ